MLVFGDIQATEEYGTPNPTAGEIEGSVVIGYDPAIEKWMALKWSEQNMIWLAGGGREGEESFEQSAIRELKEETGFTKFKEQIQLGGPVVSHYFNDKKRVYRKSYSFAYLFILDSTKAGVQHLEEHEKFTVVWLEYSKLLTELEKTGGGVEHWLAVLERAHNYLSQTS